MPTINLSLGTTSAGYSTDVVNARSYGLVSSSADSVNDTAQAALNTAALQDAFDAAATKATNTYGVKVVIPPGYYWVNGDITLPDMGVPLYVDARGARIRLMPNITDTAMFKTGMPTDNNDAEAKNDLRDGWEWDGGWLQGYQPATYTGNQAFDLNAVSRMKIKGVAMTDWSTCLRARFALHLHITDRCRFQNFTTRGVHIEEADDWDNGSASNAAGNCAIIDGNSRFLATNGALAAIRIAHSAHTIRNITIEGGAPQVGIDIVSGNTSMLTSEATHLWIETACTEATVRVNTIFSYHVDFQHHIGSLLPRIKCVAADAITVGRLGYGTIKLETPTPSVGSSNTRWFFLASGLAGAEYFDPSDSAVWINNDVPVSITSVGNYRSGSNDGALYINTNRVTAPQATGKVLVNGTVVGTQT